MTFEEFCTNFQATDEERACLREFLFFIRFRSILYWWEDTDVETPDQYQRPDANRSAKRRKTAKATRREEA